MGCATGHGGVLRRCDCGHVDDLGARTRREGVGEFTMSAATFGERRLLQALCIAYALVWVMAAIKPVNRTDWLLENLLVFVFVPLLVFTYRQVPLSNVTYILIFLFLLLHAAGAHYTYSEVPLGYWLKETFNLQRNHFDRIVHLSFGLLLTYPVYEVLIRT